MNAPRGERTCRHGMVSPALAVDPTTLSSPPSPNPVWLRPLGGTHTRRFPTHPPATGRAGEGHRGRQPNGYSCLDGLALLPYSTNKDKSTEIFPSPSLNQDVQSAKCSIFKEDDRALPF